MRPSGGFTFPRPGVSSKDFAPPVGTTRGGYPRPGDFGSCSTCCKTFGACLIVLPGMFQPLSCTGIGRVVPNCCGGICDPLERTDGFPRPTDVCAIGSSVIAWGAEGLTEVVPAVGACTPDMR